MADSPARKLTSKDWWFRDRSTGEIVVAQFPNAPLWIFLAAVVVRAFATDGTTLDTAAAWTGTGALAWWSLDELIRGVNPWRRALGAGGLGFVAARLVEQVG
jgi:hypothetical protein